MQLLCKILCIYYVKFCNYYVKFSEAIAHIHEPRIVPLQSTRLVKDSYKNTMSKPKSQTPFISRSLHDKLAVTTQSQRPNTVATLLYLHKSLCTTTAEGVRGGGGGAGGRQGRQRSIGTNFHKSKVSPSTFAWSHPIKIRLQKVTRSEYIYITSPVYIYIKSIALYVTITSRYMY